MFFLCCLQPQRCDPESTASSTAGTCYSPNSSVTVISYLKKNTPLKNHKYKISKLQKWWGQCKWHLCPPTGTSTHLEWERKESRFWFNNKILFRCHIYIIVHTSPPPPQFFLMYKKGEKTLIVVDIHPLWRTNLPAGKYFNYSASTESLHPQCVKI